LHIPNGFSSFSVFSRKKDGRSAGAGLTLTLMGVRWASARGVAALAIAAGALPFGYAIRRANLEAHSEAEKILGSLGSLDQEGAEDAAALRSMAHAPLRVREAFLETALSTEKTAAKLRVHEQGLMVALSQIRYADAAALFRSALVPALRNKPQENAAEETMAFMRRWTLIRQLSADDAMSLASQLSARIPEESQSATRDQLAVAVTDLAPMLTPVSAESLAKTVSARLDIERDPNVLRADRVVLDALAPVMTSQARNQIAQFFIARVVKEHNAAALLAFKPAVAPLSTAIDTKTAARLSQSLVDRITMEYETAILDPLVGCLRPIAAKTDAADAQRISAILLRHIQLEPDSSVLVLMTQAMAAFGDKLPPATYEQAADVLLKRIAAEHNTATLSVYAYSMGVLNGRARSDQFEQAAREILTRLAAEHDLETLSNLSGAISSVADFLTPASAEKLCGLLVSRIETEQDPGKLLYLAVAMESMADEARGPGAATLADRLIARIRKEQSPHMLRSLAFNVAAFTNAGVSTAPVEQTILERMSAESKADDLRTLTSALYSLRKTASPESFEKAASILASQIQTQLDLNQIRSLAASLHALAEKAGPEPYERAASAIIHNARDLTVLEPALARIAPKIRLGKARELARILEQRIASEQDPAALRVLGHALADLPADAPRSGLEPILQISQAPCAATHSPAQIFNPLCSEEDWTILAREALKQKPRNDKDAIDPDFTQLASDDDDDAPGSPEQPEEPIDFQRLSAAVQSLAPAAEHSDTFAVIRWSGIVLMAAGALTLLWTLRKTFSEFRKMDSNA
jgi:hypothetical protein